jgi:hypothetical protein
VSPRAQGFARGDIDTAFPLDDKFVALRGTLTFERYYAATGVYFHVVAATWREAERKPAIRICPDASEIIGVLVGAGLLDADGRVPSRAFTNFVGRARRQRKSATERQARNRAQKSREVTRDERVTISDSAPLRTVGTVVTGTETGGDGGRNGQHPSDDPYDDAVRWLAQRKAWVDSPKIQTELARLVDRKGAAAVIAAMAAVPGAEDAAQFVYGARNALYPLSGTIKAAPPPEPDPDELARLHAERRAQREAARRA